MRVGYFVGLFCMTAFAFVACEKAGEDGGNKELRLTVDCSDLVADGVDKVTFTVKYGEEDVTAFAEIRDAATGEVLSGSEFSTDTVGSYEFVASYDGKKSNKVSVRAEAGAGLILLADRESIVCDGREAVTFTVMLDGDDVTKQASISDAATGDVLDGNEFATDVIGSYKFVASYNGQESNKVAVEVIAVSGELVLSVDKESIMNDGRDRATFTVTFEGQDVTVLATIVNQTSGETWDRGVHSFASYLSDEYEFKASYQGLQSNTVKVVVTREEANPLVIMATRPRIAADGSDATSFKVTYEGGDVTDAAKIKNLATGEYLESNSFSYSGDLKVVEFEAEYEGATSEPINVGFGDFYKNVLFCRFTATWCGPCTSFSSVLSAALEQYPDRLVQVAIHQNDEYTSNNYYDFASYFKFSGIPAIFFDFDKEGPSAVSMSAADVVNTIKEYQATGAKVGIAMSSTVDAARNVKVTVRVTPSEAGSYLLGVALLEDGIEGPQNGTSGYIHDNTMRALATSLGGDSLGDVAENTEVVKEYTFSLKGYTDNCRVVAYVNTADGDVYATTNAASCPVNGRTDYRFETAAE